MARKAKQDEVRISPFWKPTEEGDMVEGKFVEYQQTQPREGKTGLALVLDSGKLVGVGTCLKGQLAQVANKLKSGMHVKVMYLGRTKTRGGNKFDRYRFWLGKEEIPQASAFGPASPEFVSSFLQSTEPEKAARKGKSKPKSNG